MLPLAVGFLLLTLFAAHAAAPIAAEIPVELDAAAQERGAAELAGHLQALHDPDGSLSQAQVSAPEMAERFAPLKANFNGGFTPHGAWWLRFDLQVQPGFAEEWWLRLGVPYVDYVDVWIPERAADGTVSLRHRALGGMRPVSQRDLDTPISVLRLEPLPEGGPHTVWIRVSGHRTLSLTGGVWRLDALASDLQRKTLEIAGVIGMVILMAVVTLLLGLSLPDRKFLWYSAYLATSAVLFACSENLIAVMLLPEQPQLAVRIHNVMMCLGLLTALLFVRSLLDMPTQFPRITRLFHGLIALTTLGLIIALAGRYDVIAPAINFTRLFTALLVIALCVVLVRRGQPSAWPNLIGYSVFGTVGAVHFAKNLDWLPFTAFTQYSYLIGMMVHLIAIFFGLGLRVRLRERQALADSLIAGARLEATVTERTTALNAEVLERQNTEAQLRVAMDEQRNFLAMVSHEFRTPLSIIGASAQMIVDERLPTRPEDVQREAGKIDRAAQRMNALVDTLLADEWLESSAMQIHARELDLCASLRQLIQRYARGSDRDITFECPPQGLSLFADPMLLNILLDNLLENAIKYSPANTAIELVAQRDGTDQLITVRDHGPGIPSADIGQIFERFYRSATVKRQPGIGLGLFMVRRIAEIHGGTVSAGNAAGGGALFTIRLPAAPQDEPR
ncbi:sensor histidine kinase [Panacagrimonas perspica]|uniref:sensor histidine kinase n=1 Tax=Panacagrimonas perspica TaxID=381431 RepID=UPI0013C2FBAC|nr:sensor histidine kinase [Panacagrimonas perspica]